MANKKEENLYLGKRGKPAVVKAADGIDSCDLHCQQPWRMRRDPADRPGSLDVLTPL
jgi:hypothetical protein